LHWKIIKSGIGFAGKWVTKLLAMLQPGTTAPGFELFAAPREKMTLQQFRGKRVVLVFYPADWLDHFEKLNAQVLGISVDGKWCHASYHEQRNLGFPLLADFEPKGAVAKAYGVYSEKDGTSERALFVLDENGTIQWSYLSDRGVNPGADGILSALEKMEKEHTS
jgi:peroxiredoxin